MRRKRRFVAMVEKRNEGLLVEASPSERPEELLRRMVEVQEVNGVLLLEAAPDWAEAIETVLEEGGIEVEQLRRARLEELY
jgi:hypothetical protein